MNCIEDVCTKTLGRLNDIKTFISVNGGRSFPKWVFDVESCGAELAKALKSGGISLGYSGKFKEDIAELRHLRQAIIRLSGICSTGGFGLPPQAIYKVIATAVEDLEKQMQLSVVR